MAAHASSFAHDHVCHVCHGVHLCHLCHLLDDHSSPTSFSFIRTYVTIFKPHCCHVKLRRVCCPGGIELRSGRTRGFGLHDQAARAEPTSVQGESAPCHRGGPVARGARVGTLCCSPISSLWCLVDFGCILLARGGLLIIPLNHHLVGILMFSIVSPHAHFHNMFNTHTHTHTLSLSLSHSFIHASIL